MADDEPKTQKTPEVPPSGAKSLKDLELSENGEKLVRKFYKLVTQEDGEPTLNTMQETAVKALTGKRVGPFEAAILPFGTRNPLIIGYESVYPTVGDRRLNVQVGIGTHTPTLNEVTLKRESEGGSSEFGLLAPRDGHGPSVIGNTNPKPPLLNDKLKTAGGGVAGGFGYRETKELDNGVTVELQAAIRPNTDFILQPTKPASATVLSGAKTDSIAGIDILVAGSIAIGEQSAVNSGIILAAQRKLNDKTTVNFYGEVARGDANIKRIGGEMSYYMENIDASPYVRMDVTQASGAILPNGITEGKIKTASIGIAKDLSENLRGFCEVKQASDLKSPMVQCGFKAEFYSGVIPSRSRK